MTTLTKLRKAMLACAADATRTNPTDIDARARSFTARLSGSMASLGETELERALDQLLGIGAAQAVTTPTRATP